MDIATATFVIIAAMGTLLILGVPLAFVSGSIAVVLAVTQFGWNALFVVGSRTVDFLDSFALIAVPMFVLMASIMKMTAFPEAEGAQFETLWSDGVWSVAAKSAPDETEALRALARKAGLSD